MLSTVTLIRKQQRTWAHEHGIATDSAGYADAINSNLFVPLSAEALAEFGAGDGGELGQPGKRGKIQALHSSSALACNFFEHWRGRDASPLASALKLSAPITTIKYERKFPTGLPGNAPNLDVVLPLSSGSVTAIECKFLEPYGGRSSKSSFKKKYFESKSGLWHGAGYPLCQELAQRLYAGQLAYKWLNAEQLLKHILGLAASGTQWTLLYLWYEVPDATTEEHASEISEFASMSVADGIDFRALSYQAVFRSLRESALESDQSYLAYLGSRYFAPSV